MMLQQLIARNIREHGLLEGGAVPRPVLVAVSGGADSVALLVALDALGYECVAAHCNYHLRGDESNRDMRSVQQLCRRLGIDLYVKDMDVEAQRAATGESVEMACRTLRYRWFADLLDRLRAQAIAVAHHREDNIETFFLNLMRGSGIAGLTGMRWRNGYVVRPMLDASRADIEEYLRSRDIPWVDDSTNAESVYARNRLRNIILPAIEEQFPGAIDGILASISHLADNREGYDEYVSTKRTLYVTDTTIDLRRLVADEPQARLLLLEWLRPLGFNATHVSNILGAADRSGITFTSGNTSLLIDRGTIKILANSDMHHGEQHTVSLRRDILAPLHIVISEHPVTDFRPERNPRVAYFDTSILGHSVTMRHWQRGDRMQPYGMTGTRLVSDIYSDAKLSIADKRQAWVMTCDDTIIWLPGLRQSAMYSIGPETRRYLRLELRSPESRVQSQMPRFPEMWT